MAKKYNAQMVAQSLETAVMSSFQNNGSITKMDDGTYIVVGANSSGYFAQRLNDDLSKVGEILTINNSAPTNGMIEISANSETEFTGIWTSNENSFDIVQQFFSTQETTSTTTYETVTTTETVTSTVAGIDLTSGDLSREALTRLDTALQTINSQRAELGSLSNRLDHIIANNTNASTNTKASLGRIQDADFAAETTKLAKSKILEQSSTAMLAQANASVYEVLTLIPD
jgi:flagellin-like hook-associated protein FlgL